MKEETKKVNQAEETNSSEIISQPVNTLLSGLDDKELTNYATIANEIEEIVLDDNLAHYDIIPDYLESTQSIHPIGVKINGKTHIIDGWEKVDRAKNEGKASIKCCVYYINEFSDIEIALRKISIRMLPLGGTLRYSEILRNISIFKELLLKSSVNIVEYSHGGNRKDKTAGEINIRDLLAERTGKEPGTIGNYFLHADYISKKAFDELVKAEEATKAFFEKLQSYKSQLVKGLREDKKTEKEKTKIFSKKIVDALASYANNKKLDSFLEAEKSYLAAAAPKKKSLSSTKKKSSSDGVLTKGINASAGQPDIYKKLAELGQELIGCSKEQTPSKKLVEKVSQIAQDLLELAEKLNLTMKENTKDKLFKAAA